MTTHIDEPVQNAIDEQAQHVIGGSISQLWLVCELCELGVDVNHLFAFKDNVSGRWRMHGETLAWRVMSCFQQDQPMVDRLERLRILYKFGAKVRRTMDGSLPIVGNYVNVPNEIENLLAWTAFEDAKKGRVDLFNLEHVHHYRWKEVLPSIAAEMLPFFAAVYALPMPQDMVIAVWAWVVHPDAIAFLLWWPPGSEERSEGHGLRRLKELIPHLAERKKHRWLSDNKRVSKI